MGWVSFREDLEKRDNDFRKNYFDPDVIRGRIKRANEEERKIICDGLFGRIDELRKMVLPLVDEVRNPNSEGSMSLAYRILKLRKRLNDQEKECLRRIEEVKQK